MNHNEGKKTHSFVFTPQHDTKIPHCEFFSLKTEFFPSSWVEFFFKSLTQKLLSEFFLKLTHCEGLFPTQKRWAFQTGKKDHIVQFLTGSNIGILWRPYLASKWMSFFSLRMREKNSLLRVKTNEWVFFHSLWFKIPS